MRIFVPASCRPPRGPQPGGVPSSVLTPTRLCPTVRVAGACSVAYTGSLRMPASLAAMSWFSWAWSWLATSCATSLSTPFSWLMAFCRLLRVLLDRMVTPVAMTTMEAFIPNPAALGMEARGVDHVDWLTGSPVCGCVPGHGAPAVPGVPSSSVSV